MSKRWIIVAESALARIVEENGQDLRELPTLTHFESRRHPGDLKTGGKGAVIESTNASSHQPDPATTTHEKQSDTFAKEVADFLSWARTKQKLDTLTLVAEPAFLGHLRAKLDSPTGKLVTTEIDKNWTNKQLDEIRHLVSAQVVQ